jgi:predicted DNA-binding antitoxin AbrB/MazE fold protein
MVRTIKAKYSKGVFEPLETVVTEMVSDGEEVLITISTIPAVSGDPLTETSGGWKGLIDMEALKQNIYADRLIATRPKVRL